MWEFFNPANEHYYEMKSYLFMFGTIVIASTVLFVSAIRHKTEMWSSLVGLLFIGAFILSPVYGHHTSVIDMPGFLVFVCFCTFFIIRISVSLYRQKRSKNVEVKQN